MDILALMGVLIEYPLLGLVPAIVFIACFIASKHRILLIVGILWLLYSFYELAMKYRLLCSGECNIRIDLLVLYPVLLLASIAGVVALVRASATRSKT